MRCSILLPAILLGCLSFGTACATAPSIVKNLGTSNSPDGGCRTDLSVSTMGGAKVLRLTIGNETTLEVKDVTAIAWAEDSILAFSVSPVYGKPGIFTYDCHSRQKQQLVAPKTINKGYPHGADYFDLSGVSGDKGKRVVEFYRVDDVDSKEFLKLHTKEHLERVPLHTHE